MKSFTWTRQCGSVSLFSCGVLTSLAAFPSYAASQSTPEQGATSIEVVVVTARKQSEMLQDTPVTLTALTGEQLSNSGINDFRDYLTGIPGVFVVDHGPGQSQLAMRGVIDPTTSDQQSNRETVGLYFDETPVSTNGFNPDLKLFDVERVEVLRGPQGTLYGAGSMSGTVRVITKQPDSDGFAADLAGEVSSTEKGGWNYAANGMINIPLGTDLAVRAVGYHRGFSGYIDNIETGQKNVNTEQTNGGRAALRWDPDADTTITASVILQDISVGGSDQGDNGLGVDTYSQRRGTNEAFRDRLNLYNLTVRHSFGDFELVSATSYLNRQYFLNRDITYPLQLAFGVNLPAPLENNYASRDFSQELRLSTPHFGPLSGVVGAFYQDTQHGFTQTAPVPGFTAISGIPTATVGDLDNLFEGKDKVDTRQVAVFGEVNYDLTSTLQATAGIRWFTARTYSNFFATGLINGGPSGVANAINEDGLNPKFGLSWKPNANVLVYAEAARGFRLGGINSAVPVSFCGPDLAALGRTAAPIGFRSDSLWNYEAGAKTTLMDGKLVVDGAAYLIDWDNLQTEHDLACGFNFIENAGKVHSKGVELEVTANLMEGLVLSVRTSYTDAALAINSPDLNAPAGTPVPYAPKWNLSLSGRYSRPILDATNGFIQLDYLYVDPSTSDFNPVNSIPQPAHNNLNLRVGVENDRWQVALFAENLTNEVEKLNVTQLYGRFSTDLARPRTIGVKVGTRW